MNYMIDTDTLSLYLKNHPDNASLKQKVVNAIMSSEDKVYLNGWCYYEHKRYLLQKNAFAQLIKFDKFIKFMSMIFYSDIKVFDIASDIWAKLAQQGKSLKGGGGDKDIFTAATSIAIGATVVTENESDFKMICSVNPALVYEKWKD